MMQTRRAIFRLDDRIAGCERGFDFWQLAVLPFWVTFSSPPAPSVGSTRGAPGLIAASAVTTCGQLLIFDCESRGLRPAPAQRSRRDGGDR